MGTKFNLDREPVTDEEINSHKDFGELVNKFKKQSIEKARSDVNFLKNKKVTYSAIIAGVAVVCTVTYFAVFKKEPPKETVNDKIVTSQNQHTNSPENKQNKAFIAPPISKLNVPYSSYKVKAEQGATIKHKSNSKIIIPKNAFIDKQGQDIVGEVEIKYREFHNQADIIASGIPMTYDSAGVQSHLESAGMIDIKGYQNGVPVFINPKKQITVEFASEHKEDKYNMYELDTIAKNWTYISRDNSLLNKNQSLPAQQLRSKEIEKTDSPKANELQKQIDAIPPKVEAERVTYNQKVNQLPKHVEPNKPAKAIAGRPQFQLDVNYKEFPELAAFKNAVFEVGTENKNYNSKLADVTWSSAEVSEGPQKGKNYLLTLKLRERVEKLIVYPALSGADYEQALKSYESKFAEYKTLAAKREADEKRLKEEFEAKQAALFEERKRLKEEQVQANIKYWQEQQRKLDEEYNSMGNQEKVVRIFNISRFNIYNSDCPHNLPNQAKLNPTYIVSNGKSVRPITVYLISHSRNIVYNLQYGQLPYNPNEKYSLCILTNGKLYLCNKETFSEIIASKQNKIPVTELDANVNDAADLKKAIGI
ncbi:MAG TPA: OmpH family outer membrane protein [Bacteroidia bacterium]|nr:OmpH family outer membrane protein [Bacteroidia bacterium]